MSIKNRLQKTFGGNLASGRERIRIDALILAYPHGVTINGIDLLPVSNEDRSYPIFTFAEDDTKYFCGSGDIPKLGDEILEECEGCISDAQAELKSEPLKVRIMKVKTKSGYWYTKVEVMRDDG